MTDIALPQQRQDALVAQHRLPRRLQQLYARAGQRAAEFLGPQVFPRVQLEQRADHRIIQRGETAVFGQADVLDGDGLAMQAGLRGAVTQIIDGAAVFIRAAHGAEVQRRRQLRGQFAEALDQRFMDRVELVGVLRQATGVALVFQPLPLEEAGLEQRGRRVVVQFVQLGRTGAVVGQVQAPVQMRLALAPAVGDPVAVVRRNRQLVHQSLAGDDIADQVQRHLVQLGAGVFDVLFDLAQGEGVVRAFIPVRLAIDGVEAETRLFRACPPLGTLGNPDALHGAISRRSCRWCCGARWCCRSHHGWR
ncbi:hypothetical protein G6F46_013251 [Rhizopus delemar]|nr:hypothetical protein G6F46_013251 [Rhizopus delemar]